MSEWRSTRFRNPAAWLTVFGVALMAFSMFVPWLTATRTARIENRADETAAVLLDASAGFEPPLDGVDRACVLARFYRLATARGVRVKDIELLPDDRPEALLTVRNKHYVFRLASQPPRPAERPTPESVAALEVFAWPLQQLGPAHAAFYYPENAARAFTRNLRSGYFGTDAKAPAPAAGHRRPGTDRRRQAVYVGRDDERWYLY